MMYDSIYDGIDIDKTIEEILIDSPKYFTDRIGFISNSEVDVELEGVTISTGDRIVLWWITSPSFPFTLSVNDGTAYPVETTTQWGRSVYTLLEFRGTKWVVLGCKDTRMALPFELRIPGLEISTYRCLVVGLPEQLYFGLLGTVTLPATAWSAPGNEVTFLVGGLGGTPYKVRATEGHKLPESYKGKTVTVMFTHETGYSDAAHSYFKVLEQDVRGEIDDMVTNNEFGITYDDNTGDIALVYP